MYRKPNGEYTEDVEEMTEAWNQLAGPIEKATGWKLYAFSPDLCFYDHPSGRWGTASIPVPFAQALSKALQNG